MNSPELGFNSGSEAKVKKFKLYKFITLMLLVAFLIGGLMLFKNDITLENLRYLIKYLDFSSSGAFDEETVIHYNEDTENSFHVFRGDLALVNDGGVTLFDRRGSAVMTDSFNMSNPVCVPSDRYLAVYDLGGYQIRIYNSFSLLHEMTYDYPIQAVSLNSDGAFCVVTSEKSYHSAVLVYDRDFVEVHRWLSADKFAVDATLSDDEVLTVSTVKTDDGGLFGEIIALEFDKKEALFSYSYRDQMPLYLSSQKKHSVLLTDDNLFFLDDGKLIKTIPMPDGSLRKQCFGEELCCVLQDELSVGVNYLLRVFDRKGEELHALKFSVQILDIEVFEDTVYVLTHGGIYIIGAETQKEIALDGEFESLGVLSDDVVLLCGKTTAEIKILK